MLLRRSQQRQATRWVRVAGTESITDPIIMADGGSEHYAFCTAAGLFL
jgi:hypothetical protein